MAAENWIYKYYQQIKDGSATVGNWIRLLYEYLIHGLEDGLFFFDQKKANAAIDYIEAHTFHTEGPKAPGNLILEPWQKAFLSCVYGIVDEKGNRQFREVLLVIGRKNGKTLLAAGMEKYDWMKTADLVRGVSTWPRSSTRLI